MFIAKEQNDITDTTMEHVHVQPDMFEPEEEEKSDIEEQLGACRHFAINFTKLLTCT